MRVAILKRDRCTKGKDCDWACKRFCPRVRAGDKTIEVDAEGYPVIDEGTCIGCGICIKKCPQDALVIINLPEELKQPLHQFGINGFRLFSLPIPKEGQVVGFLGANGTGKTTAISILNGSIIPNLGNLFTTDKAKVLDFYAGTELHDYFDDVQSGIKMSVKPQHIVGIPKVTSGTVRALLDKVDERGIGKELIKALDLTQVLDNNIEKVSGGELQRIAIAACLSKDAQAYFIDEPSSFLDIYQRLNAARVIKQYAKGYTFVVEHDLVVLDYLSDVVHIFYGTPAAYGIVSGPKGTRVGINAYLEGFLKEENTRFRGEPLKFEPHQPFEGAGIQKMLEFSGIEKTLGKFHLYASGGVLNRQEVIGVLGPNGIGKTTFVRILAGALPPDKGEFTEIRVAYKPQYLQPSGEIVGVLLKDAEPGVTAFNFEADLIGPLGLRQLKLKRDDQLSGGELQRLAIALTLAKQADVYLLDEPSAFLDVEQRLIAAKVIRRIMEKNRTTAIVVDHDLMLADYLSDRMLVFIGTPGERGDAYGPMIVRDGMNKFLKDVGITFRRDPDSKRPRANKEGSKLDQEQKGTGNYYYPL